MKMKVSLNISLHKNIQKCKKKKLHIFAYLFSAGGVVFFAHFISFKQTAVAAAGENSTFFAPEDLSQTDQMAHGLGKQT